MGARWWSLFFEHSDSYPPHPQGSQRWHIEAYDHGGRSWIGNYYYWPGQNRWRHVFCDFYGEDYGRYPYRETGENEPQRTSEQ